MEVPLDQLRPSDATWRRSQTPAYLSVFADVVAQWASRPQGEVRPQSADVLQGVLARVRQLLRIHDELAWIALMEGLVGSSNDLVQIQSELLFDAVSAVNATLDGLTVWLVAREPVDGSLAAGGLGSAFERFVLVRSRGRRRSDGTKRVVDVLRNPLSPILELTTDLWKVGYHYHPLLGTSLQFSEFVQVTTEAGQPDWRVIRETAGAVCIAPEQVEAYGLPDGADGIIAITDDAFALPWGLTRAVLRDFMKLTASALEAIANSDGHPTRPQTELIDPDSPYARFVLDYTSQLPLEGSPDHQG